MIANFGRQAGSIKTITDRIKEKASAEGFDEFEIGLLAREILKKNWTKDQLYKWFPTKPKAKLEESTSETSTESKIVGKKGTDERYPDQGIISDDKDIPEDKVWKPTQDVKDHPDYQRLQENYNLKTREASQWQKKAEDLGKVVTKDAFKPANEVQGETFQLTVGMDVQYFKYVKLERILPDVVQKLRGSGWKQAEIWARVIKE